ncbi:MAG: hypothetical protein JWM35_2363, partial [Verrucomicrobia bacterium]|nr:hypothetical protein [Verrucomicrobiota bacterium]
MKTIARLGLIRPFLGMLLGGGCALTWVRAAETQESDLIPCLACTGDYQPIAPNASIAAEEKQLFVVFHLAPNEHFKKLVSSWVADDVGAAAPPGYKLGKGELRLEKSRSGQLRYFQSKRLPVGKYHVDVVADGKPWRSATFTVVDPPVLKIDAPSDLMPLTEGQTWTYDFVQEVAPGATLSDSDLKPEADGKLH